MLNNLLHNFLQLRLKGLIILAVIILIFPLFVSNPFHFEMATQIAILAATVVGLNLLVGFAGQISLGHAGFFGVGAYFSAIMTGTYAWPPLLTLIVAAAFVAVLAWVVGRPILKLKGHYLSMATLAIGFIIYIIINNEGWITGGPDGISVPSFSIFGWELSTFAEYSIFGLTFGGDVAWYLFSGAVLLVAVWFAQNIIDSPIGRALRSVHGSEIAARVVGVDTAKFKSLVFVISAVYASVMGSFFAHFSGHVTPHLASFEQSIVFITMVVLGGMASTYGVILGALMLTLLPQLLTDFQELEMMMFGLILMLTMIFMPKGLLPTLEEKLARFNNKKTGDKA